MKDKELEDKLRSHFQEMVNRYRKLRVRFEYSESRGVYLVSYYSAGEYDMDDCFFDDLMAFEDKMNYLYGDEAPLFCFEEKYFRLSKDAEVIESVQYDEQFSLVPSSAGEDVSKWHSESLPSMRALPFASGKSGGATPLGKRACQNGIRKEIMHH